MAQNPMGELQNNPQMKETLEFIQQNGGDARAVAYMLARQKGQDADQLYSQINNML